MIDQWRNIKSENPCIRGASYKMNQQQYLLVISEKAIVVFRSGSHILILSVGTQNYEYLGIIFR